MATPSAPASPASTKRTVRPRATAPASPSGPFLRFYHSEALRKRTLAVLDTVEQAPDAAAHRQALAEILVELTNVGLDYFFLKPLAQSGVNFLVQQSARLGLAGAQQVMRSIIHQIIGRMDRAQLRSICGSVRQFML